MASADAVAAGAGQASNNDILAALNTIGTGLAAVRAKQDEQEVALTDLRAQASLTAAATTGLSARLTAVESGAAVGQADAKKDEDPEEALDYVPYFDGREENPFPLRPRLLAVSRTDRSYIPWDTATLSTIICEKSRTRRTTNSYIDKRLWHNIFYEFSPFISAPT
eukprot:SAG31_NODE_5195_length_2684_cov_2.509865_1_plen_166_part_00